MSLLISNAVAAVAAPAPGSEGGMSLTVIMLILFVAFYFVLIRPQNKRSKEHRELVSNLKKGDEVVTVGGILAKVSSVDDQYIKVNITEGIEVSLQRSAVNAVLPKGTLKSL